MTKKAEGDKVEVLSLQTLQPFRYQGKTYTKRKVHPGGVSALSNNGSRLITLSPDTLVTPIEAKSEVSEPEEPARDPEE